MGGGVTPQRKLGFWSVMALVIGSSVGIGILLIPASLASYGSIGLLGWIFTSLGTLLMAFSFMRLSALMPAAGGPYAYCREGFGDFIGFEIAWNYWISNWMSNAAVAVGFAAYLSFFIPSIANNPLQGFLAAAGAVWFVTFINIKGVYESGLFQLISTILKLAPIGLIFLFGIPHVDMQNFLPFNGTAEPNVLAIMGASTITMWAFLGFETGTVPATHVENPSRIIPKATFWGTLVVIFVCLGSSAIVMGLIPMAELKETAAPFALVAEKLFGSWGAILMSGGALISSIGTMNGLTLVQGQVPLAASKDSLFPDVFGKLSRRGTPVWGTVISSILITIVLGMNYHKGLVHQFTFLVLLSTLAALITYLFTILTDLRFLLENGNLKSFKGFWKTCGVLLAFGYVIWAIVGAGEKQVFLGAFLFFALAPVYIFVRFRKKQAR
jgi:APA family basic amino acid/polyamine antiporter